MALHTEDAGIAGNQRIAKQEILDLYEESSEVNTYTRNGSLGSEVRVILKDTVGFAAALQSSGVL